MNKYRYKGEPCVRGHSGIRYKANRTCVECARGHNKNMYAKSENKIPREDRYFLKMYGINKHEVGLIFDRQDGLCNICFMHLVLGGRNRNSACVDHNHITGKVRGLLCNHCNRGLGMFMDNPKLLESAITYLEGDS